MPFKEKKTADIIIKESRDAASFLIYNCCNIVIDALLLDL